MFYKTQYTMYYMHFCNTFLCAGALWVCSSELITSALNRQRHKASSPPSRWHHVLSDKGPSLASMPVWRTVLLPLRPTFISQLDWTSCLGFNSINNLIPADITAQNTLLPCQPDKESHISGEESQTLSNSDTNTESQRISNYIFYFSKIN